MAMCGDWTQAVGQAMGTEAAGSTWPVPCTVPHFWKVPLALTVSQAVSSLKYKCKLQPFMEVGCVLNTQLCVLPFWCLWNAGVC